MDIKIFVVIPQQVASSYCNNMKAEFICQTYLHYTARTSTKFWKSYFPSNKQVARPASLSKNRHQFPILNNTQTTVSPNAQPLTT